MHVCTHVYLCAYAGACMHRCGGACVCMHACACVQLVGADLAPACFPPALFSAS